MDSVEYEKTFAAFDALIAANQMLRKDRERERTLDPLTFYLKNYALVRLPLERKAVSTSYIVKNATSRDLVVMQDHWEQERIQPLLKHTCVLQIRGVLRNWMPVFKNERDSKVYYREDYSGKWRFPRMRPEDVEKIYFYDISVCDLERRISNLFFKNLTFNATQTFIEFG